jgi:hypothetical protein
MAGISFASAPGASLNRHIARAGLVGSVLLTAALVGSALFAAFANHLPTNDPDDTRGPFDVRRVEVLGQTQPRWKVITWPRWGTAEIWDTAYATVFIDSFGPPRADFYILVGSSGDGMYAHLYRDRATKRDIFKGALESVGRSDRRSFYVRVKLSRVGLGDQRTYFRWRVSTSFTGDECRRVCFDAVPDDGFVLEPLPVETPSPTPTPSPSSTE